MERVKEKNKQEKAASVISVEETEEEKRIREAVEEFIQEELDIDAAPNEKGDEEKKREDGAEMLKRACETFGKTRKRHLGESSITPGRSRNNDGRETLVFLNRKLELDQQTRKEEMEWKRAEEERRHTEDLDREHMFEKLQQQMLQQQQQFQQQQQQLQQQLLLQQQQTQQQIQTMIMTFIKALEKNQ